MAKRFAFSPWLMVWTVLGRTSAYQAFSKFVGGGGKLRHIYTTQHLRIAPGDRVLDIGCGPADILSELPSVDYYGFDMNKKYIESARLKFAKRGQFFHEFVTAEIIGQFQDFDIVMANGVIHHLNDKEALNLLEIAAAALKPKGRLVTLDGVFTPKQSLLAKYLVSRDRGRYVRDEHAYLHLAQAKFASVQSTIYDRMLRIPYTHIVMEMCQKSAAGQKA